MAEPHRGGDTITEAHWTRDESVIDQQIRMAQERGDFDDLPGKGKPRPGLDPARRAVVGQGLHPPRGPVHAGRDAPAAVPPGVVDPPAEDGRAGRPARWWQRRPRT